MTTTTVIKDAADQCTGLHTNEKIVGETTTPSSDVNCLQLQDQEMQANKDNNHQTSEVNNNNNLYVSEWDIESHFVHNQQQFEDTKICIDSRIMLVENKYQNLDSDKINLKDNNSSISYSDN